MKATSKSKRSRKLIKSTEPISKKDEVVEASSSRRKSNFLHELMALTKSDDSIYVDFIRWSRGGDHLIIEDEDAFFESVVRINFASQTNISSFNRQLLNWRFKRLNVKEKRSFNYPVSWRAYKHDSLTVRSTTSQIDLVIYRDSSKKISADEKPEFVTSTKINPRQSYSTIQLNPSNDVDLPIYSFRSDSISNPPRSSLTYLLNSQEDSKVSTLSPDYYFDSSTSLELAPISEFNPQQDLRNSFISDISSPSNNNFTSSSHSSSNSSTSRYSSHSKFSISSGSSLSSSSPPQEPYSNLDRERNSNRFDDTKSHKTYLDSVPFSTPSVTNSLEYYRTDSKNARTTSTIIKELSASPSREELMNLNFEISDERSTSTNPSRYKI